jgi:hypothetical protein
MLPLLTVRDRGQSTGLLGQPDLWPQHRISLVVSILKSIRNIRQSERLDRSPKLQHVCVVILRNRHKVINS